MDSKQVREKFLEFFKEKGHVIIPSASLIPENDPTVLFTTAGMHPLIPFLMGEKHPAGKRLTNIQKCLRTNDIDEVGDVAHNTFFEMLGYWSLGDYFKKDSIHFTFDFYTKILGFQKDSISVTVFEGDQTAPFDEESYNIWKNEIGIPSERIYRYPKKENWWGPAGQIGPCGPCTEMFIDTGKSACNKNCGPACSCGKFVEIGNNVFLEYSKIDENNFELLKQKNVDVGLGFERLVMFSQDKQSVYDVDFFVPIINKIEEISKLNYEKENIKAFRIIADHLRAATFILAENIEPSNLGRGYVTRRLIRRAIRYGRQIGIQDIFTFKVAEEVIKTYQDIYPELRKNRELIINQLVKEEEKFSKTLEAGLRVFKKHFPAGGRLEDIEKRPIETLEIRDGVRQYIPPKIESDWLFDLYQNYSFDIDLSFEELEKAGVRLSLIEKQWLRDGFNKELRKHQELSRTASAGMFKGGLADSGEKSAHYHTATHLLLAALRQVLGDHVYQRGSNINAERMRFDFSHLEKLADKQIKNIEDIVNEKIKEDLSVVCQTMSLEEAKKKNMMGIFENKYGDQVKTYTIGNPSTSSGLPFSQEICGGPHANRTGELGHFKIVKEESSGSGVRRIKAILE